MKKIFYYILLILVLHRISPVNAQMLSVQANVDTNIILIGDQVKLSLEVGQPASFQINFPQLLDTIVDKVEILEDLGRDTLTTDSPNHLKIKQSYLITSFDSGIYVFPPFNFTFTSQIDSGIDTLSTIPMYFGVMTMALDTANPEAIADIKQPYNAPLTFREILPFAGIALLVLFITALLVYYFVKKKKNEPVFVRRPKPLEPPHIIAYRDLDKLRKEKLWQKNLVKEYHSRLTEILRTYIEYRFQLRALEQTSDEIIDSFKQNHLIDSMLLNALQRILHQADLVKFAKAVPLADENEKSMNDTYLFVDKTKQVFKTENEEKTSETVENLEGEKEGLKKMETDK